MTDDRPPATAERADDGRWIVRFERHLRHAPPKVWRALTESEHLAHWLPCDIVGDRRPGAPIRLVFWPPQIEKYGIDSPELPGQIRTWDPPHVFEWTWDTDVLRWELEPTDDGTRLTFTTWLGPDPEGTANAAAGYHVCLDQLTELLDSGTAGPLVEADAHVEPLQRAYRAALAAADEQLPETAPADRPAPG